MIRALYSCFMWLAQPFLVARLKRRGVAEPTYAVAMEERFGHYAEGMQAGGYIWLHAVSLGETRTAALLIHRLRERLPGMRLLLTHGTATGRLEGQKLLRAGDVLVWQPWDTPGAVRRFLDHFKPRVGLLMETEVWPNLSAACQRRGMPLVLVNARLSDKSLQQSLRLAWLARPAFRSLAAVWAQTEADAARLRMLQAKVQGVFGNLKFDATPDATLLAQGRAWRAALPGRVVMFASSREGEEASLLEFLKSKIATMPVDIAWTAIKKGVVSEVLPVQWLIVPRHPQRFDEVAALVLAQGFAVSRRSTWANAAPAMSQPSTTGPVIWLGDTLGEMALYYGLSDAALLGGSFEPLGGQNLIEAAACGCPVVMGPHTFNFAEAAELAQAAGAALRVDGLGQAVAEVEALTASATRQQAMAVAAQQFAAAHRGAVNKTVAALEALI